METVSPLRPRIDWVDAAKAYGIFLVFYGHFVETVHGMGNEAALVQQKLVYSFHMPLFILLAGFLAKTAPELPRLWPFLKRQAASRLLPVVFFSVLMIPLLPVEQIVWDWRPSGPSLVKAEWIDDWPDLCRRLSPPAQGEQARPCQKLWTALPASVQSTVKEGAAGRELDEKARSEVVASLNQALAKPDLFALEDFSSSTLSSKNHEWLSQDRSGLPVEKVRDRNMHFMWQVLYPEWAGGGESFWGDVAGKALETLRGWTVLNIPVWFLICLFMVELIHYVAVRFLTGTGRIALAIPLFFAVGWALTRKGLAWGTDIWFAREDVFLYSFYLMGFWLRRTELLERGGGRWSRWPLFVVGSAVLLLTFDLNPGSKVVVPVVLINLSQHGDFLWFTITALAGCLAVAGLARLAPGLRVLSWTGRHTLILMGLNGFFFSIGNPVLAVLLDIPHSPGYTILLSTVATLVSLALSMPVVWLLDRYLPQLVGRPRAQGPLLPRLA